MKWFFAFLFLALPAMAQPTVTSVPWYITGFGTLAVSNSSVLLSTMTAGPNSGVWPTAPQMMYVTNAPGGGILYVCPLGGTCSSSVGIPIAAGSSYGFFRPAATMTVISASTSTAVPQWGN